MKITINVPSWHRPNNVKTLRYLPRVTVWVDESEYDEYRKNYPTADIVACPQGVQGNLCRVRNYIIRQTIENGDADVCLIVDDDLKALECFYELDGFAYNRRRLTEEEVYEFIERYSELAAEWGAKYWGVNCNSDNMSWLPSVPFSTNAYIGGPFQCFLRGNKCYYDENLPLKEDYDMTLQQLNIERIVLRVNWYHYICEQSTIIGGCAAYRNRQREEEQFNMLQRKWGSRIVRRDMSSNTSKRKLADYNPIIKVPIRGI